MYYPSITIHKKLSTYSISSSGQQSSRTASTVSVNGSETTAVNTPPTPGQTESRRTSVASLISGSIYALKQLLNVQNKSQCNSVDNDSEPLLGFRMPSTCSSSTFSIPSQTSTPEEDDGHLFCDEYALNLPASISRDKSEIDYLRRTNAEAYADKLASQLPPLPIRGDTPDLEDISDEEEPTKAIAPEDEPITLEEFRNRWQERFDTRFQDWVLTLNMVEIRDLRDHPKFEKILDIQMWNAQWEKNTKRQMWLQHEYKMLEKSRETAAASAAPVAVAVAERRFVKTWKGNHYEYTWEE